MPSDGKTYTVKAGDTLSKIAKDHLGDANAYMKIFEANKPMLKDPDFLARLTRAALVNPPPHG